MAGAVNVIGAPGGPFYVIFGGGVVGGNLLQYAGGPAVIITPSSAGIAIIGPGLAASAPFSGAVASTDGSANTLAAPLTLTGAATLTSNLGSLTLTGPLTLGSNALTLAGSNNLTLKGAINSTGMASLTKNGTGTATLAHDNSAFGTGGTSGLTTGLVAGGGITVNNGILSNTANQTLGAVTDTLTFGGAGSYTLGYNGFAAPDSVTFAGTGTVNFAYNGGTASFFQLRQCHVFRVGIPDFPRRPARLDRPRRRHGDGSDRWAIHRVLRVRHCRRRALVATAGSTTATVGQFAYTAATTAAQLQAYLLTIPGLASLPAANVMAGPPGVFTIYGANIAVVTGAATSVTSTGQNAVTVASGASLGFSGANYLAQQPVSIAGAGVVNGLTTDGAIVGLGGTAYFGALCSRMVTWFSEQRRAP